MEGTNNERGLDNSMKRDSIDYNTVLIDWLISAWEGWGNSVGRSQWESTDGSSGHNK